MEEVALARPISRVHCRQRYKLKTFPTDRNLSVKLEISILEEGRGSRKGCSKTHVFIRSPVIEGLEREAVLEFLTSFGVREEDGNFIITSMSCYYYEIIAMHCRVGGCLNLYMNVLVSVDHYNNMRRGIKIDQDHRIIKADQYDGVWDSNSIVVDHDEGWVQNHVVLFDIDDDNTLRYTFGNSLQFNAHSLFLYAYRTNIKLKPASEIAVRRMLKRSLIEENKSCSICLDELVVGGQATTLPCRHQFHSGCILEWFKKSHFCPLCRFALPAQPLV